MTEVTEMVEMAVVTTGGGHLGKGRDSWRRTGRRATGAAGDVSGVGFISVGLVRIVRFGFVGIRLGLVRIIFARVAFGRVRGCWRSCDCMFQ